MNKLKVIETKIGQAKNLLLWSEEENCVSTTIRHFDVASVRVRMRVQDVKILQCNENAILDCIRIF